MDNAAFAIVLSATLFIVGGLLQLLCCLVTPTEHEWRTPIPDDDAFSLGLATPPIQEGSTESDRSDDTVVS